MTPQSAKSKGRLHQQYVRDTLLESIYTPAGLTEDDCRSTSMGCPGLDILLSSKAKAVCHLDIEAKCREALPISSVFAEHYKKYEKSPGLKLLVSRRNRHEAIVTLRWTDFLDLLKKTIKQ